MKGRTPITAILACLCLAAAAPAGAAPAFPATRAAASPAGADTAAAAPADTSAVSPVDTSTVGERVEDALIEGGAAPGDSAAYNPLLAGKEEQADTAARARLQPSWSLKMEARESYYRLSSGSNINYLTAGGWIINSKLNIARRKYRGRDLEDTNQSFANTASRLVPGSYSFNIGIGETYLRQKAFGLSRAGGDMVIENEHVNTAFIYMRPLLMASRTQVSVSAGASRGQNDFKYDRRANGSVGAYFWYDLPGAIRLEGGAGFNRKRESSEVGYRNFDNMPSENDTIRASLTYGEGDRRLLDFSYQRRMAVIRKVDPPRGNSLEVIDNPDLAIMERSEQLGENIALTSRLDPSDALSIDIDFLRTFSDQQNLVDERLNKATTRTDLDAGILYAYHSSGSVRVSVSRSEDDYDYGPISLSSYVEESKKLSVALKQGITDSLDFSFSGTATLRQKFYKKSDANPRDADYLYYSATANMDASPFPGITTGVKFTFNQYETINIDATLSADNRTDYTYWVIPNFTVRPAPWITIGQEYQIKSEFTDFTYDKDENDLNRTTIMETDANLNFYLPLRLMMRHRYVMKDKGSYLVPEGGGEREYGRTDENFENRLDINMDYEPVEDLTFFAYSNFRFQEANLLGEVDGGTGVVSSSTYESGEIRLGVQRTKDLGDRGGIDLDIGWVKRYGPNLTPERREFWDMTANVEIKF